jgi:uncharacterized protein RhaS with RHS repeats
VTGRYTQPDPLRFVDGPSVYAYAGNSPWSVIDPTGLELPGGARDTKCGDSGWWQWLRRGQEAHITFAVAARAAKPTTNFSFNSSLGGLLSGRTDVRNNSSGAHYEVKPTTYGGGSQYFSAKSQLNDYINQANSGGISPRSSRGDWSDLFGKREFVDRGRFRFFPDNPSRSGLVFYECLPEKPPSCSAGNLSGNPPNL